MKYPVHYRVEIMEKAQEILKRQVHGRPATIAQDRVYRQRYSPLGDDPGKTAAYLPAVIISTLREDTAAIDYTQERRTIDLVIECYVTDFSDLENPLDVLTEQIETMLYRDQTLERTVEWIRNKSSEWIYDKDSESEIEGCRVTYEVKYIKDSTSTLPLDDFDEVDMTTEIGSDTRSQIIEVTQ